jgi:hypothetical protein
MKQYLNSEQTAKLIELGFEKPGSIASVEPIYGMGGISVAKAYSIGELIEMLPNTFTRQGVSYGLSVSGGNAMGIEGNSTWVVSYLAYGPDNNICIVREELIDALYCMLVKLKEEGVI